MGLPLGRAGIGVDTKMGPRHGTVGRNGRVERVEGLRDAVRDIMTPRDWECLISLSNATNGDIKEETRRRRRKKEKEEGKKRGGKERIRSGENNLSLIHI